MQNFFALVGTLLFAIHFQIKAAEQTGFLIKTAFEYKVQGKALKSESIFTLESKSRAWTTLSEPKNGIALLGRLVSSDSKSLEMEYIVVDTNQKNVVISTPGIRALLGETAKIEVGEKNGDKVLVSLLAQSTEHSSKK